LLVVVLDDHLPSPILIFWCTRCFKIQTKYGNTSLFRFDVLDDPLPTPYVHLRLGFQKTPQRRRQEHGFIGITFVYFEQSSTDDEGRRRSGGRGRDLYSRDEPRLGMTRHDTTRDGSGALASQCLLWLDREITRFDVEADETRGSEN
jgi:hypothetical protein